MITNHYFLTRGFIASFVILAASLFASCSFREGHRQPQCTDYEDIPFTQLTSHNNQTVFENPGTIIAIHGSGSAKLDYGDGRSSLGARIIKVGQSVAIPNYANRATVFLNGWRLSYSGSDHHVVALGALIAKIRTLRIREESSLGWEALGFILDNGGDEGYNLSYNFTVIAWKDGNLDAVVDHGIVDPNDQYHCSPDGSTISDNFVLTGTGNTNVTTALASFYSFIENSALGGGKTVAVLPRGFGFTFADDHHLLQVAYNLDHSEVFADSNKQYRKQYSNMTPNPSRVDPGFVSWNTNVIFKDNDTRRDYGYGEIVSGLGGTDVGVVQPPFSILPSEGGDWFCGTQDSPPVRMEEFVIENIPFQFAIPMLTGWDLQYACSDQHVKEIGIWIDRWKYEPPSGGVGGRLRYTVGSVLRDDDNNPDYAHNHKITILGLKPGIGPGPGG